MGRLPFPDALFLIAVSGFVIGGLRIAEGFDFQARVAAAQGPAAKARVVEDSGLPERLHMGRAAKDAELARIANGAPVFPAAAWAPVGYGVAKLVAPLDIGTIRLLHHHLWWLHALMAFGLIVAVPFTKAFHLISSPANMLLRGQDPPGRLQVAAESGVRTVRDLTWRQLLQVDACTWCGKCQEACPANHTGFPLSPRNLVQAVDWQLLRTPVKANGETASLYDTLVKPEELWSCCSCRACEEVCPVLVQHPRLIVDLRRSLVDQGKVDEGLQDALMNFQRYGNSFGQSARKRPEWAKPLDFKLKDARKEEVEYLWFVGDYASYDKRAQEVSQTVAKLLHHAGVDVGLLFEKEQNAGNDVRRIGEEGLFSMVREKNLKELAAATFHKLLTTDPHTYNTLKNEYGANGQPTGEDAEKGIADKPVLHYTELLDELIGQGKLKLSKRLACAVDLPRPVLPGTIQRRVRGPAADTPGFGGESRRDAAAWPEQFLLRGRRRTHLDEGHAGRGGAARRKPHQGSPRLERRRLPCRRLPEGPGHVPGRGQDGGGGRPSPRGRSGRTGL